MRHPSIYLDYAAATPIDKSVLTAMEPFFNDNFCNPSADYQPARYAAKALAEARSKVAKCLGSKPTEVIFTSGATEANNLAVHGIMRRFPGSKLAISAIEHDSVRKPTGHYPHNIIPVDNQGLVSAGSVDNHVDDSTVLVSVIYANNEIGTVQPIRRISAKIVEIRKERQRRDIKLPLFFHIDGAQAGNYLDLHVHRLGVDLMTLNGGKLYGPKGMGVLYVRAGLKLMPLIEGGGQERSIRSGTENVAGAVGLSEALDLASRMRKDETARLQGLNDYFRERLQTIEPNCKINGSLKYRLPNNLHVTFPDQDNEKLLILLDQQKIYAAAGSACSASKEESSHVLSAMGVGEADIRGSLRFSMGRQTTKEQIDTVVSNLRRILIR